MPLRLNITVPRMYDTLLGYSLSYGISVFVREKYVDITKGMGAKDKDDEGRVITVELDDFYLINTYVKNSSRGLVK